LTVLSSILRYYEIFRQTASGSDLMNNGVITLQLFSMNYSAHDRRKEIE